MRPLLALVSVTALALLPWAAEAGMRHNARVHVVRIHHFQHAPFGRLRSTRTAANLAPFFGPDYLDDGIEEPVADATPYGVPLAATLAGLPRRPTNERATLDVEKGVTVVRGPGSQHVLP